ncbi:MAG TPA: hypothetical protein V6D17_25345 [Candidatus Obscuribacterales bacterium]
MTPSTSVAKREALVAEKYRDELFGKADYLPVYRKKHVATEAEMQILGDFQLIGDLSQFAPAKHFSPSQLAFEGGLPASPESLEGPQNAEWFCHLLERAAVAEFEPKCS